MDIVVLLGLTIVALIFMFSIVLFMLQKAYERKISERDAIIEDLRNEIDCLDSYIEAIEEIDDELFFRELGSRLN